MQRLLQDLVPSEHEPMRNGARWPAPGFELRLHQGVLIGCSAARHRPDVQSVQHPALTMDLSQPGLWPVPGWAGAFEVTRVTSAGAPGSLLQMAGLRQRAGGERFATQSSAAPRSLKKQYQCAGIAAWQRQGPLLWTTDGRLLFAPTLGIDARCQAPPGEPQCSLRWVPDQGSLLLG